MRYAVIDNNTVVNIIEAEEKMPGTLPAHPWTNISDVLVGGKLPGQAKNVLNLNEARAIKLAEIMVGYNTAFGALEAIYPAYEREGWPRQEAEAKALQADPNALTPVLSTLVQLRARGETVQDLATAVLQHAITWPLFYAYLTGQQQRMYGEVSGLQDVEEIQAYPVEYRMPEGF